MSALDSDQKQFIGLLSKQFGIPAGEAAAKALDIAMSVPLGIKLRPTGSTARLTMAELGFDNPVDLSGKLAGLEAERDAFRTQVGELEASLSGQSAEIVGLRSLISDLNDEIERLKAVPDTSLAADNTIRVVVEPDDEVLTLRERVANLEAENEQLRSASVAPVRERKVREPRTPKPPKEPRAPKAPKPPREDGVRVRAPNEAPLTSITVNGELTETKNWRGGLVAIGTYLVKSGKADQLSENYFPKEGSKYTTTFEVDGASYYAYTNLAAEGIRKRMDALREKFSLEISYTVRE